MKIKGIINRLSFLAIVVFMLAATASAQTLLVEDFSYAPGTPLTSTGNWAASSGAGINPITVTAGNLFYTNYPSSAATNSVTLSGAGEDDFRTFAQQTNGSVYAAFLVNVTSASTGGDYFFSLANTTGQAFAGRVFVRRDAANALSFGISKGGTTAGAISYTGFNYALNTTYLLVVKYTVVAGTANDTVDLFINPSPLAAEPATATVTAPDAADTDLATIGSVVLRQGGANAPTLRLDTIRVATTFAAAVTASPTASFAAISGTVNLPNTLFQGRIFVTLTDMQGNSRTVTPVKGGIFRFRDVAAGETYILSVSARGINYAPQIITVNEDVTGITFQPLD
jgi:hypothetical protein